MDLSAKVGLSQKVGSNRKERLNPIGAGVQKKLESKSKHEFDKHESIPKVNSSLQVGRTVKVKSGKIKMGSIPREYLKLRGL